MGISEWSNEGMWDSEKSFAKGTLQITLLCVTLKAGYFLLGFPYWQAEACMKLFAVIVIFVLSF
jgi:hypothetical protein